MISRLLSVAYRWPRISSIEDYEDKYHPLPRVSPNQSLNTLMEERGLKHKDIWPVLGNKGAATEVLSGPAVYQQGPGKA